MDHILHTYFVENPVIMYLRKKGIHVVCISQAHTSAALSCLFYYFYHCRRHFFTKSWHIFRLCATEGERIVFRDTLSLNIERFFAANLMTYRHGDDKHSLFLLIPRYPCFKILTNSASADETVPETERMCYEEADFFCFPVVQLRNNHTKSILFTNLFGK